MSLSLWNSLQYYWYTLCHRRHLARLEVLREIRIPSKVIKPPFGTDGNQSDVGLVFSAFRELALGLDVLALKKNQIFFWWGWGEGGEKGGGSFRPCSLRNLRKQQEGCRRAKRTGFDEKTRWGLR